MTIILKIFKQLSNLLLGTVIYGSIDEPRATQMKLYTSRLYSTSDLVILHKAPLFSNLQTLDTSNPPLDLDMTVIKSSQPARAKQVRIMEGRKIEVIRGRRVGYVVSIYLKGAVFVMQLGE